MVYIMKLYTDGVCRNNGRPNAIAVAAAVPKKKWGKFSNTSYTSTLPSALASAPAPKNQRAKFTEIILALEMTLDRRSVLHSNPKMSNEWIGKWRNNRWRNSKGKEVINRDLIEAMMALDGELRLFARVKCVWIPRSQNRVADRLCCELLDG
ncbi:ribonuclease H-like protein [Aspergillus venezuelensis]